MDIDSGPSRLRKLKQSEKEKKISGKEYSSRLKEQYSKIIGQSEIFDWANVSPDKTKQAAPVSKKSGGDDQDNDDLIDPIQKLLQSNTSIFKKDQTVFKPGKL